MAEQFGDVSHVIALAVQPHRERPARCQGVTAFDTGLRVQLAEYLTQRVARVADRS